MIYTEIKFYNYKTERYVTKAFKGDFLEAIKNRVAKKKLNTLYKVLLLIV